ncbi:MAG TPA: hypothetical protein V6C89_04625 [Drouetiella sp.]|jgi:urease accessory protein
MTMVINALPEDARPRGPVEFLELTWEERCKPRRKFVAADGTELAISLTRGSTLVDGMTIYNSPERTIVVKSKPERVLTISPKDVMQYCLVAHNLGNWHRSMQVFESKVYTHGDTPLEEWLARHGVEFSYSQFPYNPNLCTHAHD